MRMKRKAIQAYLFAALLACAGVWASSALSGCIFYLNPQCNDQISNGDETGLDCGGSCPQRCNVGDGCSSDADCDDSTCRSGTCTAFPCANGVKDGDETDVDCGGTCRKCAGARQCTADTDCFSGTCEPASMTCSGLTMVSFADAVSYDSGFKTYAMFTGDLNGDGVLDIAAANEAESSIAVFINLGTGVFQRVAPSFPTGEYPTGITSGDFNNDHIPDVVTANYHGNSVSVLLNNGSGVLGAPFSSPTVAGAETSNLAVGDVNGDGKLDVVATNPSNASISQFFGNGDGTLGTATTMPLGIIGDYRPFSVAVGDFDENGTADIAVADVLVGPIIVKLGNGDGTYQAEQSFQAGGTGARIMITADMNHDGHLDLISANRGSNDVSVLIGRGDGTFRKGVVSTTGRDTGPYAVAVADFNRDGVPDVFTANYVTGNGSVLLGIGDGTFEDPIDVGPTGSACYGAAAGDFDGDGKPDLANGNANDNNVTVKLSTSQ